MPAAAVATIVLALVLVAVLAYDLIRVVLILRHVVDTLGEVTFGVRTIAHRAEPIDPVLAQVNGELAAVAEALEALVPASGSTEAAREPA